MWYFGFGSNLDAADLARWCEARGFDGARIRFVERAWLPEHELAFHYHSKSRRGGALDVRPRVGAAVPGALFEVNEDGWRALDYKEGAGVTYARREVVTLDARGEERRAVTYRVRPDYVRDHHVPPTDDYRATVARGLRALDHPTTHLESASSGLAGPCFPDRLFIYGTLMRGEERARLLEQLGARWLGGARVAGRLVDLGAYPGLVRGDGQVQGELVQLPEPTDAFALLDEVEDFLGYGADDSMYRRVLVELDGLAWTYRYLEGEGAPIASGDWRRR